MVKLSPGKWTPAAIAVVAVALLMIGGVRLPADLIDLPGALIAKKLIAGTPVPPHGISRVLKTREESLKSHATADRWITVGHAQLMAGNPVGSADAFANGLRLAPARGIAWAAYANALEATGDKDGAAAARRHSVARAPYDPRAVRLRRR
ncbi:MAG: hypothetical protein ACI9JL_001016 [Paracoccaceae bacterium]